MNVETRTRVLDAIERLMRHSTLPDTEIVALLDFIERNVPDPDIYTYLMIEDTSSATPEGILERALAFVPIPMPDRSGL